MSRNATAELQKTASANLLPPDHVLNSGAVTFPGAFDQQGCPLVLFPVEQQCKLNSDLKKEEVVDFINYFLRLQNKYQERDSLVSVVVDLRNATLITTRFVAETLQLLELPKRTVHTLYVVQPKKREVLKSLLKLLMSSHAKSGSLASIKSVFLKDVSELCNYIDRSQLTPDLGGYLVYCHQSWVTFLKEMDGFVQEFLSVVHRLPSCIASLQTLARQAVPSSLELLQAFCSANEARFQQLRRDLGLDELLRHCECVVEKLRYPENEPCYQDMAGTALFTHTVYEMLQNYNRITAAVQKVELLWQQAFSKARTQLRLLQLHKEAKQIIELMDKTRQEKLQPYRIEVAKDVEKAESLKLQFEMSIYGPAMALVHRAVDVMHMLAETIPSAEVHGHGEWIVELDSVKEKFLASVELPYQTLKAVSDFYYYYNKSKTWYNIVLRENFFQDLLWNGTCDDLPKLRCLQVVKGSRTPPWKHVMSDFLKKNPSPEVEELAQLAHLANVIPDPQLQQSGKWLSHRCMILRKLLASPGALALNDLHLALRWQYEFLRGSQRNLINLDLGRAGPSEKQNWVESTFCPQQELRSSGSMLDVHSRHGYEALSNISALNSGKEKKLNQQPLVGVVQGMVHSSGKPPSLSSFDSGFDGAGSTHLDTGSTRESWSASEAFKPIERQSCIHEENISSVSDSEECKENEFACVGGSSNASIRILPKITGGSLNVEIKVQRCASLPKNPWLSLPVEELEKSYTVTVTPGAKDSRCEQPHQIAIIQSRDQPNQIEISGNTQASSAEEGQVALSAVRETEGNTSILQSQDSFEDSESSPLRNLLSSTIADSQEKAGSSADSFPSLLWDTYDFHNIKHDSSDRLVNNLAEVSLNDWDLKEQESLQEVEKILERAAEILQEEENVLAQEEILDHLLNTGSTSKQWVPFGCEAQPSAVRVPSKHLLGAGVDFDDGSCLVGSDEPTEFATCTWEHIVGDTREQHGGQIGNCDVLEELRDLHILEKKIMEESLKICELRQSEESDNLLEMQLDQTDIQTSTKERQAFLQELEKENQQVKKMEMSLRNEMAKGKPNNRLHRGRKVVKCSIMSRTSRMEQDSAIRELVSSCKKHLPVKEHKSSSPHLYYRLSECDGVTLRTDNIDLADQAEASQDKDFRREQSVNHDIRRDMSVSQCVPCDNVDSLISLNNAVPGVYSNELSASENQKAIRGLLHTDQPKVGEEAGNMEDVASLPLLQASLGESDTQLVSRVLYFNSEVTQTQAAIPNRDGDTVKPPVPKPRMASRHLKSDGNQTVSQEERKSDTLQCKQEDPGIELMPAVRSPPKPMQRRHKQTTTIQSVEVSPEIESNNNNELQGAGLDTVNKSDSENAAMQASCYVLSCLEKEPGSDSGAGGLICSPQRTHLASDRPVDLADQSGGHQYCRSLVALHHTREISDFGTPIVLDTGSALMKAGLADQDLPTAIFPTVIGFPKYEEVMNGASERDAYIGHEAQHMRGILTLKYPMKHGIVYNWDEMEKIWHHTFQQLHVEPEDHPVLLTEAAMNPRENRQHMVQLMFETFCIPYTYVAMQAVLALYAAGRTTGVVFDSGDGVSHTVPVFEGYCLPHGVQRFSLAGSDVTLHLRKVLQEQGVVLRTSAELEIVREMKEQCCYVAQDYEADLSRAMGSPGNSMCYTLPDGQVMCLGAERFRAPEILFRPELIGRDHYGMHESIFKSILHSDIDLRKSLVGNVVLSGGNTLLPGLPQRLQSEITRMVPEDLSQCVRVSSPKDRDFSVWSGGAVLANLSSFNSAWISQEEYEEFGPQIVFRKCF